MASKCRENEIHGRYKILWHRLVGGQEKYLNIVILYNICKFFHCWYFFVERTWSENHHEKKYLTFCLTLWYKKIWSKEPLQCMYDFRIIHRSSLRTVEMKPVSFYMIHNLSYETKLGRVTKLLKAHVKNIIFFMGYSVNMHRQNISLVTKLA